MQAQSKEERGRTQRLGVAPASPLTLPSPPKGRGKEERASPARMTEAEAPHAGMTKAGRAPSFPDSSPPPGRRIKERGDAPRKRSRRKTGDAPRGSRWRQRPPSPSPLPPRREGDKNEQRRAGMTAVGRPAPACHPRAWPLHGGGDARRASPFPDSSPPPGERIKERGTLRASGVEGRGGTHPEARGGASSPPHPPLSPQGERETRTRAVRGAGRPTGVQRHAGRYTSQPARNGVASRFRDPSRARHARG